MKNKFFKYILLILIYSIQSCSSQKEIIGTYRSNHVSSGFFITNVKLKKDSSFEYRFSGDLVFDTATGRFQYYEKKIFLVFDKGTIDTSLLQFPRTSYYSLKYYQKNNDSIPYQMIFFVGNDKLFEQHGETGKKVKRAFGYSKSKKFIFFGSHYHKRRIYLAKRE